jgi:hypothetical protein
MNQPVVGLARNREREPIGDADSEVLELPGSGRGITGPESDGVTSTRCLSGKDSDG